MSIASAYTVTLLNVLATEDGHQPSLRQKDRDPTPQDPPGPHQTERSHSQEGKQTTKKGGIEKPTRDELVDKPPEMLKENTPYPPS